MPTLAHGPRLHCAPIFALAFRIRRMIKADSPAAITATSQCVRNIMAALPAKKPANRHVYAKSILSTIYHPRTDSIPRSA